MTADREFIFWIAIVCVVICSTGTDIGENNNGMCKRNISYLESQKSYYTVIRKGWCGHLCSTTHKIYNITYVKKWGIKDTCCENYKDNNGTCKPQCSSPSTNCYCEQPDICKCNPGWSGYMCNVSLLCIVNANSTTAMSKPSALQKVQNISKSSKAEPVRPACHSKCQEHFNRTDAINTTRSADGQIQYLIPIKSPCNMISADQMSSKMYTIGGVIMGIIMLLLMVLGTVYVVRRIRKTINSMNDKPTESIYDDVKSSPNDGYVVPTTPVYADIIAPPSIAYDEINLRTSNHYDIVI